MSLKLITFIGIYFEIYTWQHTSLCNAYQYFILGKNGDYKYGYKTDNGIVARQEGDSKNQVSGHYFYGDDTNLGNFGVKYTSGVQGFVPEKVAPNDLLYLQHPFPQGVKYSSYNPGSYYFQDNPIINTIRRPTEAQFVSGYPGYPFNGNKRYTSTRNSPRWLPNQSSFVQQYGVNPIYPNYNTACCQNDASYSFSFDTGNFKREESSDKNGDIMGYFQYRNDAGVHDLRYTANDRIGFNVINGNLATVFPGYLPRPEPRAKNWTPNFYNSPDPVSSSSENKPLTISTKEDGTNEEVNNNNETEVPVFVGVTPEMETDIK